MTFLTLLDYTKPWSHDKFQNTALLQELVYPIQYISKHVHFHWSWTLFPPLCSSPARAGCLPVCLSFCPLWGWWDRKKGRGRAEKKILPTWHCYETASSSMAWHMFKTKSDAFSCGTFVDPAARSLRISVRTFCEEGVLCGFSPSSSQFSGSTPPRPSVLGSHCPSETFSRAKFKWSPNQLTPTVVVHGIFNNTDRSP